MHEKQGEIRPGLTPGIAPAVKTADGAPRDPTPHADDHLATRAAVAAAAAAARPQPPPGPGR